MRIRLSKEFDGEPYQTITNQIYPGRNVPIIDEETFQKVQARIAHHRLDRKPYKNKDCSGLLTKVLKCKACGSSMVHTYTFKENRRKYRYYLCSNAQKRGYSECSVRYVNAPQMEERIEKILRCEIKSLKNSPHKSEAEAIMSPIWDSLFFEEKRQTIKTLIKTAEYDSTKRKIFITLDGSSETIEFDSNIKKTYARENDKKRRLLEKEPPIRRLLIFAHQINSLINENRIKDLNQASTWIGSNQSRLSQIVGLLQLSPTIQAEIMTVNLPVFDLIPEYKIRDISSEVDWSKQATEWQEIKNSVSFKNSISDYLKPEAPVPSKWLLQS